jgi:enoyl-CoA hydratase/carnithine racemase
VVMGLPETGLGIIPAAGGTQTVPRAGGIGITMDMLLTGRRLSADEALKFRLVNQVLPREQLMIEAGKTAETIASLDPLLIRMHKKAINRGMDMPLGNGLEMEKRLVRKFYLDLENTS